MLKKLIKLFFPEICSGCSEILLENETSICVACRHHLPLTNHLLDIENEGFKRFYGRIPVAHSSAMLYYHKKGIVQQLIHNLKYKNHQEIGTLLGNWYAEDLKANLTLKDVDYIVPVPLHKKRLKERGYNQVTTFSKAISSGLGKKYDPFILIRKEYAATQSKKNLANRNSVSENTFGIQFSEIHHDKHFLLVDDVLTTGATLEACGKALLQIPGSKISIVTMAMSQS
ncbi:ComF family protein [Flavobacterium humi]|uniref:ComF family protein n=1 Tax=Flavobacterium humi TaxID=2562683 RepID=A0A4Z0L7R5_9FLAO|nr:ComF family protein [Flavobacterium humi]